MGDVSSESKYEFSDSDLDDIIKILNLRMNEFKADITKQFKVITAQSVNSDIQISNEGTRVEFYSGKKISKDNIVSFEEGYRLYIGKKELAIMIKSRPDLDVYDSFMKLISHEYLHILYGDFSSQKLNAVYNFNIGSMKPREIQTIYFEKTDKKRDNLGYKKINRKIMNIAADFVINQDLDIRDPFLLPESYKLPKYLTTHEYYKLLSVINSKDKDFSNGPEGSYNKRDLEKSLDLCDSDIDKIKKLIESQDTSEIDSIIDQVENNNSSPIILKKRNNRISIVKNKNKINKINSISNGNIGYLEYLFEVFNGEKNLKNRNILNSFLNLIRTENKNLKLSQYGVQNDWLKYNNRREGNKDLILPGKRIFDKGFDLKFRPKPVIFVDNSASMECCLELLYCFLYNLLETCDCSVVFYDVHIISVYENRNNFQLPMFNGGGTSISNAISEYKAKYGEISNTYVLTDGYDYFYNIPDKNILIFDRNQIHFKN